MVVEQASFWRRAFAFIIDLFILDIFITSPFSSLFESVVARTKTISIFEMTYSTKEIALIVMLFLLLYLYFVLFEYVLQQTPGMMFAKTKLDGNMSFWTTLVRNSFLFPVLPFILLWVIEPIMLFFKKRTVLEYASGTRTVYQREVML